MTKPAQKSKRKRGVILSPYGLQRLQEAQEQSAIVTNGGYAYTLEQLSNLTGLSVRSISKLRGCKEAVDRQTLEEFFRAFNLTLTTHDYFQPEEEATDQPKPIIPIAQDWGEALDVSQFYGRTTELNTLKQWVLQDHCRLIGLLGIGGIGKSSVAAKIAYQLQDSFEYIIWRPLRNAPPLETLLSELVPFLSDQQDIKAKPEQLLHWLRVRRCLVVLDNVETILQAGDRAGYYQPGYENYGDLFRLLGESIHQSCIFLTSREKSAELSMMESPDAPVRLLHLSGSEEASLAILNARDLVGSEAEKQRLCEHYGYSPLALKIVASSIQSLFDGQIADFLEQNTMVFNSLRRLLDQQFERLSALEQTIMYWLAINREWTAIATLLDDIMPTVTRTSLLESLESLTWRSLIEKQSSRYTQQPVVMEYICDRLIERVCQELQELGVNHRHASLDAEFSILNSHALQKTTVTDYIRESQARLILEPILNPLQTELQSATKLTTYFRALLDTLRQQFSYRSGYTAGNILNLCCYLKLDLTGYDFLELTIRHAYVQNSPLHAVNFTHAEFFKPSFTQTFSSVLDVAISPDGRYLVSGSHDKTVKLWNLSTGECLHTLRGHRKWIWSVAFSPQGHLVASGSEDNTVRLWDVHTGQGLKTLEGHTHRIWSIAFSSVQPILASGSDDQTVRLWEIDNTMTKPQPGSEVQLQTLSGRCIRTLQGHTHQIWSIAFSPDRKTIASSGDEQIIRLWNVNTGECYNCLKGHTHRVSSVAFSAEGSIIASGGEDQTVRLWDARTGHLLRRLIGHTKQVWFITFSPVASLVASASEDQTIRLWNATTGKCLKTLEGHSNWVWSIAFSPDGQLLASGCYDQTVKLWDVQTGQCISTLEGHSGSVMSVAFSADGRFLSSGSCYDQTIRLWDVATGECLKTLFGELPMSLAFPPGSAPATAAAALVVCGNLDATIKVWNPATGECLKILEGHDRWIFEVKFSPDGQILASGSADETIRLWDWNTGEYLHTLRPDRPYEGMNITGAIGLTEPQKAALKKLGAVEV